MWECGRSLGVYIFIYFIVKSKKIMFEMNILSNRDLNYKCIV